MNLLGRGAMTRATMPGASLACLFATSALAQAAPSPAPAPPPKSDEAVSEMVVRGERPVARTSIDRITYDVTKDLAGAHGTVSDVLRNLPSVEVDVEGNIALRGQSSVQILVDGKPSPMFSGSGRAQALQQLSASTVQAIEVMTNPSAEFSPDGTGGVINIVTKKTTKPGRSASVQAAIGSFGRWSTNVMGSHKDGPLNLTGSLGLRRETSLRRFGMDSTRLDPLSGASLRQEEIGRSQYAVLILSGSAAAAYDVTARDRLSLSGSLLGNRGDWMKATHNRFADGAGVVTREYDNLASRPYNFNIASLSANWRKSFEEPGRSFDLTARVGRVGEQSATRVDYLYTTPAGRRIDEFGTDSRSTSRGLSASYATPTAGEGTLKLGYDYKRDASDNDVTGRLIQPDGGFTNRADVSNRFIYVIASHQVYATYQRPFGRFSVLGGFRLEQAFVDYDQRTTGIVGSSDYFDVHPSLHLQYDLTEAHKLSLSYSHRVSRPGAYQANPFLTVDDEFNGLAGNPGLLPQEAHSVEGGWRWQGVGGRTAAATLYLRKNYNVIGNVDRFLTSTFVVHTSENQGTSTSGGLELDTSGKLLEPLSYRLNANVAYNELQRPSTAGGGTRAAIGYTTKANIDYRVTDSDLVQITGSYAGRRLQSMGYQKPAGAVHLGWRHRFGPDLVGVVTVSDIFNSQRQRYVTDTDYIFGTSRSASPGRAFTIGLTRQLGGKAVKDPGFEYAS